MPFVLAAIAAIATAYIFVMRARSAAEMTSELMDVANDVRLAARRFGFRRTRNQHPVEGIEDDRIGIAAVALGFVGLTNLPSRDDLAALKEAMAREFSTTAEETEELAVLGRWLVGQCGDEAAAIVRVTRRLQKMSGPAALQPLMRVLKDTIAATGGLSDRQREALDDIKRGFRIR